MSHIIYCDESAEQSQVIRGSVRNEAAASIKGSYVIKRQIIWGRPNNPGAAARRSWPVWNRDRTDLLQKGTGPEMRDKCVASHGISRTEATAPCTALHALGTVLCQCAGEASRDTPPAPNPSWQRHVMPAHPVQKNRLMEDNQPLVGSRWARLEIY